MVPDRGNSRAKVPILALLLFSSAALFGGETDNPEYQRLQAALQQYQQIAASGGWPFVPAGPTIRPGAEDPRVATLARRLVITGDLENDERAFVGYDGELQAAVARFQMRHGLVQDALVGRATLGALNVPVAERIAQLRRNLDPTLQVFDRADSDFVLVNIPAFEVYVVRDATRRWSGKVVVGKTDAATPVFESAIGAVVLNPTWTVPYSIAREELLPKIQADPGFLARGGYELLDDNGSPVDPSTIDWALFDGTSFPFTLVQRAGPRNQLGRVKFLFPNEYGVRMHDTDKKYLFDNDLRAFSHGCIRVARPIELASTLLEPEGWTREQIDTLLGSGRTRLIELAQPLPLVIAYLTAEIDAAGTVFFYRDVYGLLDAD